MKKRAGWLLLTLSLAFTIGYFTGMAKIGWFDAEVNGAVVFFGFGIPILLTGGGTLALWEDENSLICIFAWIAIVVATAFALCLLYVLGAFIGLFPESKKSIVMLFGFGIPMIVIGVTGLVTLDRVD